MLRRALALTASALLGWAGIASATLAADPVTTAGGSTPAATTAATAQTTTARTATATGAVTGTATAAVTATTTTTAATGTTTTTTTAAATPPPVAADASSTSVLVVSGHGWGHGVGMSQWGADGYAQHGWSYRAILAHYYSGTTVATHAAPLVHVLLLDGRKRVTLASDSPWQVTDALGHKLPLAAGPLAVGADLLVAGEALASPLVFSPGRTPLRVGKAAYRGKLMLVSTGKRLQVVNALPLESYLLGVVGEEMPHTWPAAALEAQAVAARSYALAELENVVTARAYDLFGDTRSQVYGGIAGESPEVTAAVRATAHQAVLYAGKVATTYFFSTSGGKTASAADVWGKPAPYLVSVADPYDTLSPYHDWGPVLLDARKAGRALQAPGDLVALDLTPDPAGRVARVSVVGTNGTVTATGTAVRTALGLRSSWFTVGWLALAPPAAPLPYGQAASLSGLVRGLAGASLEVKAGSAWQPVMPVTPGSDGSFTVALNPTGTAEYRLSAGAAATAPVKLTVAPAVSATLAAGTVEGSVRPALSGAAIQLQRQDGAAWRTVATATTDTAGSFAVAAQLPPGSYRVRCAPGHGLSPGVSPPILQT